MDADLDVEPHSKPPGKEKRSLRAAIDGLPCRPDGKAIRSDDLCGESAADICNTSPQADDVLFARNRAFPLFVLIVTEINVISHRGYTMIRYISSTRVSTRAVGSTRIVLHLSKAK